MSLTPEEEQARQVIELAYRDGWLEAAGSARGRAGRGIRDAVLDRVVKLLVRQTVLARLDTMLFHQQALDALKRDLVALKASAPDGRATIDVGTFKERYGLSRKFAIPLLEYLDRERVTRRVGDVRQLV